MTENVFDSTIAYSHNHDEVKKFLKYYFKPWEIRNKVILDAGCRVGDYALALSALGAKKVIGVDISSKSIDYASRRSRKNDKVKFYQGDIADLGRFESGMFDAVFCAGTICYLNPREAVKALAEFNRVTKPGGVIVVLFQKEKGLIVRLARFVANWLPLKMYMFFIENLAFLVKPVVEKVVGRKISMSYLKYDILLGMRGLHFGIPVKISEKFLMKTIKSEQCSEETTASYKIKVNKK